MLPGWAHGGGSGHLQPRGLVPPSVGTRVVRILTDLEALGAREAALRAVGTWLVVFVAQGWDRSVGDAESPPAFLGGMRTEKTLVPVAQLEPGEEGGFATSSALLSILRTDLHLGERPHQARLLGLRTRGNKALPRINHRVME